MASHHHHQASGISGIAPLPPSVGSITPLSLSSIARNQQLWASHRQQPPPYAVVLHIAWSPSPPPSDLEALIPIGYQLLASDLEPQILRLLHLSARHRLGHSAGHTGLPGPRMHSLASYFNFPLYTVWQVAQPIRLLNHNGANNMQDKAASWWAACVRKVILYYFTINAIHKFVIEYWDSISKENFICNNLMECRHFFPNFGY